MALKSILEIPKALLGKAIKEKLRYVQPQHIELVRNDDGKVVAAYVVSIGEVKRTTSPDYPWVQVIKGKPVQGFKENEIVEVF